jgi:uncharacterized membrane protein
MLMNTKILGAFESIRTSFWFIPSTLVALATLLAKLLLAYDRHYQKLTPESLQFIYHTSPESIRSLLTTIAGSMITVTSIAFSITVVALSLASSQFGPRLIRNFMSDKGTQIVLGVFVAIFIYCLLVLQATTSLDNYRFTPGLATYFGVLLAFVGVGVLIYFIHHVAQAIQADNVVDKVYCQLQQDIERLFPEQKTGQEQDKKNQTQSADYNIRQTVSSHKDGYIQAIDIKGLLALAKEYSVSIEILAKAGDALVKNAPLIILKYNHVEKRPGDDDLLKCFLLGSKRTPIQDPEFAIRQLVEIAVRALSPGINDPYTAITCTDKLCAMLCGLTQRTLPSREHKDEDGHVRVVTLPFVFSQLANAAFNQIRQYADGSVAVTIRLLESLQLIAEQAVNQDQLLFIQQQRDMIAQACERKQLGHQDQQDIEQRLQKISTNLQKISNE